jgi:hypothetical protein
MLSQLKRIEFSDECGVNTPDSMIVVQVAESIRRGLPQVYPHAVNDQTALIVAGGPSLAETERELARAAWAGNKVIALNGAYQWCIDRNIKPSAAVILDAREFNSRFIEQPVEGCKYFLASQCHARAFDLCADRETYIWHACSAGEPELEMLKEFYFGRTYPVTGGTTVGIRAILLMRMLGFASMELFGFDSCWLNGANHAYEQPENARDGRIVVWLRPDGRDDKAAQFECAPWHVKQAQDFMELVRAHGDHFRLNVHGAGLIATMLRTGAELQIEKDTENGSISLGTV